jgi:hypothetical protein
MQTEKIKGKGGEKTPEPFTVKLFIDMGKILIV